MTKFSKHDIIKDGMKFIPAIESDAGFAKDGYIYGHNSIVYWAVVDPVKYPLHVWQKGDAGLVQSGINLNAVVFSHSALMTMPPNREPYGPVHSDKHKIDSKGAGRADNNMYALGRKKPVGGVKFTDYVIEPVMKVQAGTYAELTSGLYPVVVGKSNPARKPGAPGYNKSFADFMNANGCVAWGLVAPPTAKSGLLVVAGNKDASNNVTTVTALASIGVNDAVAMDGSDSVMLGEHKESWFNPGWMKQKWLVYGFACL